MRTAGAARRVRVGPIGDCPPAVARAVVDFTVRGRQFWIAGPLVAARDGGAELTVTSGPVERPARSPRLVPSADVAFALFRVAGDGVDRHCCPVLDLNARAFRIEASTPLEPGTVLTDLVVVLRREVLWTGEGVVTGCSVTVDPQGRRVYEARIRRRAIARASAAPAGPADVAGAEITDIARVRAMLWAICELEHDVTVAGATGVLKGRLQPAKPGQDRSRLPTLHCEVGDRDALPVHSGAVTVDFSLFGSGFRVYARVVERRGTHLTLSPAPKLREWHRRDEARTAFAPETDAMVTFVHPLFKERRVRRLLDLSSSGFALATEPEDEEMWPGLPLRDVRIALPGLTVRASRVVTRFVSGDRAGAEMRELSDRDAARMREHLLERDAHPVRVRDSHALDEIVDFHRSMKLLEPDMEAYLLSSLAEAADNWRRAHDPSVGLMRTAVVPWRGGIGATLTSVRAYEKTWMFQHNAVAAGGVPSGAGQLHAILMRLAASRADGEYIAGIIDASATAMHAMARTFFTQTAPAHRGATPLVLYAADALAGPARAHPGVVRLGKRDDALVENVGERVLGTVCARALGLRAGEIALPRTRAAYRRAGMERTRDAHAAFAGKQCVALLLRETASPGLCLSGLLSAAFLLPVLPDADPTGEQRRALCELVRRAAVPGDPPNRFLFVPEPVDEAPLLAAGFRRVGGCTLFALHRLGVLEYQRYVATRYGLLQARIRGRGARLPEAA